MIQVVRVRGCAEFPLEVGSDQYVKVSLCSRDGDTVDQKRSNAVKSAVFRPAKSAGEAGAEINIRAFEALTDFAGDYFSVELKQKRTFGDNTLLGTVIFPPAFFVRCIDDNPVEEWFPLKLLTGPKSAIKTAAVLVRITVPGGCPKNAGSRAYHVRGVRMTTRKLRVSISECKVNRQSNPHHIFGELINGQRHEAAPAVYVSVYLDNDQSTKRNTAVAKPSFAPTFAETFEFFTEAERCKLLTIKLKRFEGTLTQRAVIGVVHIPLQFYLSQRCACEVDDTFAVLDELNPTVATALLHIRLEVRQREAEEGGVRFRRLESIREDATAESAENGKAKSAARLLPQTRTVMEELGSILVEDDDAN